MDFCCAKCLQKQVFGPKPGSWRGKIAVVNPFSGPKIEAFGGPKPWISVLNKGIFSFVVHSGIFENFFLGNKQTTKTLNYASEPLLSNRQHLKTLDFASFLDRQRWFCPSFPLKHFLGEYNLQCHFKIGENAVHFPRKTNSMLGEQCRGKCCHFAQDFCGENQLKTR